MTIDLYEGEPTVGELIERAIGTDTTTGVLMIDARIALDLLMTIADPQAAPHQREANQRLAACAIRLLRLHLEQHEEWVTAPGEGR